MYSMRIEDCNMRRCSFPFSEVIHLEDISCPYNSTMQSCFNAPKILTSPKHVYSNVLMSSTEAPETSNVRIWGKDIWNYSASLTRKPKLGKDYKSEEKKNLQSCFSGAQLASDKTTISSLYSFTRWQGRKRTPWFQFCSCANGFAKPVKRNVPDNTTSLVINIKDHYVCNEDGKHQQISKLVKRGSKSVIPAEIFLICIFSDVMRTASINNHTNPRVTSLYMNNVPGMWHEV